MLLLSQTVRHNALKWGVAVVLTLLAPCLYAQGELPEEYYSLNDGLSDRNITDILQTPDGLLWLSTSNGLNRFDGYHFTTFDNNPGNPRQIAEANIRQLALNGRGEIVILYKSSYALFQLLDYTTHDITTVRLLPEYGIDGQPRKIAVDRAGNITALSISNTAYNLYRYEGGQAFTQLFSIPKAPSADITQIDLLPLRDGSFVINDSYHGFRHFSADGALLRAYSNNELPGLEFKDSYPGQATILHEDVNGLVWFALQGQKGIYHYQPALRDLQLSEQQPRWEYFTKVWEDQAGNLLLGYSPTPGDPYPLSGLYCVSTTGKNHPFREVLKVSDYIVSAYSQDFFKNLILGIDTGLKIIQNRQFKIRKFLYEDVSSDKRGAVMRGITSNEAGEVYFAREVDAWYRFDPSTHQLDTLLMVDEQTGEAVELSCGRNLEMSADGYLWGLSCLNGQNGRLLRYDPSTCMVRTYLFEHRFTAFTISKRSGLIWLVAEPNSPSGMLVSFDPESEQFEPLYDYEGKNPVSEASPRFILEADNGILWIGTENGLFFVNPDTRQSRSYRVSDNHSNGLASNVIYAIHEDEQQRLWLGTTNGFHIFDPQENTWQHYNEEDGLAENTVCGFVPTRNGRYWVGTYNGISLFDPSQGTFRNYYRKDGFSNNEFNRFSYFSDRLGNIYFGGVNGMNVFRTVDLLVDIQTPAPVLTQFSRYNKSLDTTILQISNLQADAPIVIGPDDSQFTLSYTLPSYITPRRNQFKTWLEGIDKGFVYQGNNPNIGFHSLPPGEYTLHVKGADANGNWSKEALEIPIQVKPPFVKTIWFFLLCAAFIFGLAYLIFFIQLKRKLEVERIRTKLSSDLHDEVSGLLAGIAIQTDVLQMEVKEPESRKRLEKIGEVSRMAMSKMSDVIWSIDSRKDRVDDLIIRIQGQGEEILAPLNINYRFDIGKLERERKIPVPLRQNLYFIFKEAVNNIAKHSLATEVQIALFNQGQEFVMQIEDNGLEIRNQQKRAKLNGPNPRTAAEAATLEDREIQYKTGQGLANMKMRAERINGSIQIGKNSKGVSVRVRCPKFA